MEKDKGNWKMKTLSNYNIFNLSLLLVESNICDFNKKEHNKISFSESDSAKVHSSYWRNTDNLPNGTYSMRFNSVKESRRHVDFGFIIGNSQAKVVCWPLCNLPSFVTGIELPGDFSFLLCDSLQL